jgi:CRISPR-associated protein Cas2
MLEKVPSRLRGSLSLWLLEIRAGVYVVDYSVRVRDMLWNILEREFNKGVIGSVLMLWSTNVDFGFDFKVLGENRRTPIDVDGVKLISFV